MIPCEIAVKSVIPAMRAYVAKELTQSHKMKQSDVASLLGITQTAISKYVRGVRGQVIQIDQTMEIRNMMDAIALTVAEEKISGPQLTQKFCDVCKTLRRNKLMCGLCERYNPTLDIRSCKVCNLAESDCIR